MGEDFRSLPELFKENGYLTYAAGLVFHDVQDPPSWTEPLWRPRLPEDVPDEMRIFNEKSPNPWINASSFDLIRERLRNLERCGVPKEQLKTLAGI